MRNALIAVAAVVLMSTLGCKDLRKPWEPMPGSATDSSAMKASTATDCCAMCPGDQTAAPDGSCPKCGMKPKS